MRCDFEITGGIYLLQPPHELDLHNDFNFHAMHYSVADRTLAVHWRRSPRTRVALHVPTSVCVEFREVSEFRFLARDPELPFTEDDCMSAFGYWTDEEWSRSDVLMVDPSQTPEPDWLTAISFMSGAVILIQAVSAHAQVRA